MTADRRDPPEPLCEDFTIATVIGDERRIRAVGSYLGQQDEGALLSTPRLMALEGRSVTLSRTEAEAVLVGLLLAEAVVKRGRSTPFMDGEFALDPDRGAAVLGEQLLAVRAIEATTDEEQPGPDSRLVATTPPGLDIGLPASVSRLGTRLRSSLLDAEETVRLANPYFDPDQQVIDDISRLPARGVDTRILTRQVEPGTDRHDVLERMLAGLTPSGRRNLQVRELFQLDSRTGRQAYATHAKMLIVDQELCYIGSANLTVTSLSTNFELGIVLDGPEVATATDVFDAVFDASARTTLDDGAPPGPG